MINIKKLYLGADRMIKIKICIICFILLFLGACANNVVDSYYKEVTSEEAKSLIDENDDLIIIDVRSEEEYTLGRLKDAISIPYDMLINQLDKINNFKKKKVLIYCNSGNRSDNVIPVLIREGFTKIYNMVDGISNWNYETFEEDI